VRLAFSVDSDSVMFNSMTSTWHAWLVICMHGKSGSARGPVDSVIEHGSMGFLCHVGLYGPV
jgi:hypothetical protein